MILFKLFQDSLLLLPEVILGFGIWIRKSISVFTEFWMEKTILEKIFFLSLFFQIACAFLPWISYTLVLEGKEETVFVGAKGNYTFLLLSIACFVIMGFWKGIWVFGTYLLISLLNGLLFLTGLWDPSFMITDIVRPEDYRLLTAYYAYPIFLFTNFGLSFLTNR